MPALSGMGFDCDAKSVSLAVRRRSIVSDIVDKEEAERLAMSDSIAATAGVIEGSELIKALYLDTMSKPIVESSGGGVARPIA